jgi:hypothetical protein
MNIPTSIDLTTKSYSTPKNETPLQTLPFPIQIFPTEVQDYIHQCSENLNLVPDFIGVGILSAVAALIGNSYQIQIKNGWTERPLLWLVIVGHSGIRKTPSLDAAIKPLQQLDKMLYAKYCEEWQYYKESQQEDKEKPISKQLLVTDSTIEALIPILKNNPNGLLYFKDEIIGWINDLTRYNRGSAEQQWLSIYSNQPIRLNRKIEDGNFRIEQPFANVLGGIQPAILSSLFEKDRGQTGFTNRIAFSYPDPIKRRVSYSELDSNLVKQYENFIHRFLHLKKNETETDTIEPIRLKFSFQAQDRFYEWDESFINKNINDSSTTESLKSVLSKIEALMPRVALIIQIMKRVGASKKEPTEVDLDSVNKAISLTDYFYNHYQKVLLKVKPTPINKNQREIELLKAYAKFSLQGHSKVNIVKTLLESGFANFEISKALGIPKSNITYWLKS